VPSPLLSNPDYPVEGLVATTVKMLNQTSDLCLCLTEQVAAPNQVGRGMFVGSANLARAWSLVNQALRGSLECLDTPCVGGAAYLDTPWSGSGDVSSCLHVAAGRAFGLCWQDGAEGS
jgi:hypothetical protein